jgi:hypothetical protein
MGLGFNEGSVSQESKQQILQPLSVLRPKFRVSALAIPFRHMPMLSASLGRSTIPARYGGYPLKPLITFSLYTVART